MIPAVYRGLLSDGRTRRFLAGLGVSALGDGMSVVTIAWLAVLVAPPHAVGLYVGVAVAAYTLPGVAGALLLGRYLRRLPVWTLVVANSWLRAGFLGVIAILWAAASLSPLIYVLLLAGSSTINAWGNAGQYTMLSELGGPEGRLGVNSLYTAQQSLATIVGPSLAGLLLAPLGIGTLIALDAASFAFLGVQAWRTRPAAAPARQPARAEADEPAGPTGPLNPRAAESGFRQIRRLQLMSLVTLTWVFFFLYGPVEAALPVYVAHDLRAGGALLGAYWTSFGVGALVAALATGTLRHRNIRRITLLIVAGWGMCLVPFAFAPVGVTLACFAFGGLIYGPFIPLTYALFQSSADPASLPSVLAARSAILLVSSPLGTAVGGPLVGAIGAARTLTGSGAATVLLALATGAIWARRRRPGQRPPRARSGWRRHPVRPVRPGRTDPAGPIDPDRPARTG